MKLAIAGTSQTTDVLFLTLFKEEKLNSKTKKLLGAEASKEVELRIKEKDFEGEDGQSVTLFMKKSPFKKLVLVGRGAKDEQMPKANETLGGKLAGLAKSTKATSVSIIANSKELKEIAEGFVLGSYEFTKYKKVDKKAPKLSKVFFLTEDKKETKAAVKAAEIFSRASALTRNLVNTTPNELNPKTFASEARKVATKQKMKITVFDEKKLTKLGCGGILGVGRGAEVQPRMIILEYKHKAKSKTPDLALIGKGITFDAGGLNLKPTGYIETMKQDMAGAGTVLGAMQAIAESKVEGYFLGVLMCAENAVSDKSIHPGDVLKMYNGKTVEVTNTDAEGRLVLADGLAYVEKKFKPKFMIDIATLTGAVSVALGHHMTGVMGNNEGMAEKIFALAADSNERLWPLPLEKDQEKATKGTFTDLKNHTDGVRAGSSMGAAFLSNFVEKTAWAHFDIGGTAWAEKPNPTTKYGSTASGLRTLLEVAKNIKSF